ncbi:MAG: DedA family protein, partial [Pirellulaceae bacterium]|nr:DedA family protein [Pirellulaceae bacterium]
QADILIMIPVAWTFVLAGDCVLYFLGRRYGHHVPRLPGLRRVLTEKRIAWAEDFFYRHGGKTLFMMRFLAAVRAAIWFAAGGLKIPFWKFIAYDGTAALIFVPGYLLLGWFFAEQWERVSRLTRMGQFALLMVLVAIVAAILIWRFICVRRQND